MSTPATVKAQLRLLLNNANETTQAEDATLTEANETLIAGYGIGGGDGEFILQEKTIIENGTYIPDEGYNGFNKVIVNVKSESSGSGGNIDNEIIRLYMRGEYTMLYQGDLGEASIYITANIMGEGVAGFYTKIET